jgi:predicted phosphodiesterase
MSYKAAIITDVHANILALDAALAEIEREGYDELIHVGDAIAIGPYPAETLDRLLKVPRINFVMGNHDALFGFGLANPRPSGIAEDEEAHQIWTHAQLDPALREVVRAWPWRIDREVHGFRFSCLHYRRGESTNGFVPIIRDPSPSDLDTLFADVDAPLVWYGHRHPRSDIAGRARYVNPGSLGCSPDGLARYAILRIDDDGGYEIEHRAAPYDPGDVYVQFEARDVPAREKILKIFFRRG